MRLWMEGDRSVAICERCREKVATRFEYREFMGVPDVLVGICQGCGEIASVPHQSTPKIAEERAREVEQVEARIPLAVLDALGLVASETGARVGDLAAPLLRFYLAEVGRDPALARTVKALAGDRLAVGPARGRYSVKVGMPTWRKAWAAARDAGIRSKGELVRGAFLCAAADFRLLDATGPGKPARDRRRTIMAIAEAVAMA